MKTRRFGFIYAAVFLFSIIITIYGCESDGGSVITFEKNYGDSGYDWGYSTQPTSDGGYILAGITTSYGTGDYDILLVKTDEGGNMTWKKTFGGELSDKAFSVRQTSDGGYIILGYTYSYGSGFSDMYLIKTDANGTKEWENTYGEGGYDWGRSVCQASDGGYILLGASHYFNSEEEGTWDMSLIKTDSSGNMEWKKSFGGSGYDWGRSVCQASDGGYILLGYTRSFGAGEEDFYLVKTDSSGNMEWEKTYGGSLWDEGEFVYQTTDGGYMLLGKTFSFGAGEGDMYLVKTDADGNTLWQKTYGGSGDDGGYALHPTFDCGYILVGGTFSFGAGDSDVFLVKINSNGDMVWKKTFGVESVDVGFSIHQTDDYGFVMLGGTYPNGNADMYFLKVDSHGNK